MMYVEMSVEEALKSCKKNSRVLVAIKDLETNSDEDDIVFVQKQRGEYNSLFEDVKTVSSICDDFVKELNLFTAKQDIRNIRPHGLQKIILLKE